MSGLNRYDGYHFKIFRHDPRDSGSLSDDYISAILEGPDNRLWIQTNLGFNIFNPLTERFSANTTSVLQQFGITGNTITDIKKDVHGNFWLLSGRQILYKYDEKNNKVQVVFKSLFLQNDISAFGLDKNDHCYIIHNNGSITVLNTANSQIISTNTILASVFGQNPGNYSVFVDNEGELWVHANANKPLGVLRWNPATSTYNLFQKESGAVRLNNNLVVSIQQDEQGNIWICTDHGGINIYNKKTNTIQYILHNDEERKSLSQNSITASYKDNSGIMWLGTYKQGISYYHQNIIKFPVYKHQSSDPYSLPFDDVNRFVEDAKGNIWIGTNGDGLIYFDRAANRFFQYQHQPGNSNSISNNVIVSLFIDHQQKLWIGSYFGGLDCYENGHFIHYKNDPADPNSLSDNRVWEIYEDSKMNLWIGTLTGGLNRFDRAKQIFYHLNTSQQNSIHSNYVCAFAEDEANGLWIGTSNGIDVIDNSNNIIYYNAQNTNLSNNNIICIFRDSRGLMWVGTRDGLNVYDKAKKTFHAFKTTEGLPGSTILNILEDEERHLWISTNNGLASITVLQDRNKNISIRSVNYDELDGLQGTEFNENAALKTSRGEMIFGGANGFNLFMPSSIKPDRAKSAIVLTDLQLFNRSVMIGEKINDRVILFQSVSETSAIQLRHNENILAIEFAALNYSNPEKIKYAYRLDGFNDDWVYTDGSMRKAIYTNLDPGTYTFRVKASDEDGQWSSNETTLRISIKPPFWKTPLAFVMYVLVIALALWIARRILLERARMRFEVEQQRKEAERVQQVDALKTKFFTNVSHEFRTPLSLILSPLEKIIKKAGDSEQKKQLLLVQRNAKRLLNLVNQLLDFRRMEVQKFTVHLSRQDIVNFTRDIVCSFSDISEKKDIELGFKTNTGVLDMYFDKDKLEKILFNLLSNAFKYTPSGGKVSVELELQQNSNDSHLLLKVKDSGIGIPGSMQDKIFERFYQLDVPGDIQSNGSGIGLVITREFVKLHGGSIRVESEPEKGSCFIVEIPVKDVHETPGLNGNGKEEVMLLRGDQALVNDNDTKTDSKKSTILLVEDNEDFRFYLKDNLQQKYNILEAVNGKAGWEKAKDLQPDMVVSDIMMPLMNGIEFAKKIRTDPRTSHIPVVLLTAMSNEETELEGFRAGINDYISKPFTFEILASRIRSMLNMQERLRKKFQQQVEITPADVTITPVDEEFMKRAFDMVEKNLGNPDFSVEDLSRELFMSRVALYKKILSVTGKTPIEFIRIMRMKRAAQLLQKGQQTVAEVAYEVGYNNPKIFTKYFKEQFGIIPSKYQQAATRP